MVVVENSAFGSNSTISQSSSSSSQLTQHHRSLEEPQEVMSLQQQGQGTSRAARDSSSSDNSSSKSTLKSHKKKTKKKRFRSFKIRPDHKVHEERQRLKKQGEAMCREGRDGTRFVGIVLVAHSLLFLFRSSSSRHFSLAGC